MTRASTNRQVCYQCYDNQQTRIDYYKVLHCFLLYLVQNTTDATNPNIAELIVNVSYACDLRHEKLQPRMGGVAAYIDNRVRLTCV